MTKRLIEEWLPIADLGELLPPGRYWKLTTGP